MHRVIVTGIGTEVGKTVVSAILTTLLKADYWKPIECGESDTLLMKSLLDSNAHTIHASSYSFKASVSPHQAARLENTSIDLQTIHPPVTDQSLVIETAGGLLVPLNREELNMDLFKRFKGQWIIVSRHYLGSINHTLQTIEILKQHQISPLGIIFNGAPQEDTEQAILHFSRAKCLGRLLPEKIINRKVIQGYAKKWNILQILTSARG